MFRIYRRLFRSLKYRSRHVFFSQKDKISRFIHNQMVRHIILPAVYSRQLRRRDSQPSERQLPCFLVLRPKYFDANAQLASDMDYSLSEPLRFTKIAETVEYYFDLDYPGGILDEKQPV